MVLRLDFFIHFSRTKRLDKSYRQQGERAAGEACGGEQEDKQVAVGRGAQGVDMSHLDGNGEVEQRQIDRQMPEVNAQGDERQDQHDDEEDVIHAGLEPVVHDGVKVHHGQHDAQDGGRCHEDGEVASPCSLGHQPQALEVGQRKLGWGGDAQAQGDPEGGDQPEKHGQHTLEPHGPHVHESQQIGRNEHQETIVDHHAGCHYRENEENAVLRVMVLIGGEQRHERQGRHQREQRARVEGDQPRWVSHV